MINPNVILHTHTRVLVQRRDTNNHSRCCGSLCHKVRAAQRAKATQFPGGRLVTAQVFLPLRPAKVLTQNTRSGHECCRMGFAARVTMAVAHRHVDTVNFIADGPQAQLPFIGYFLVDEGDTVTFNNLKQTCIGHNPNARARLKASAVSSRFMRVRSGSCALHTGHPETESDVNSGIVTFATCGYAVIKDLIGGAGTGPGEDTASTHERRQWRHSRGVRFTPACRDRHRHRAYSRRSGRGMPGVALRRIAR